MSITSETYIRQICYAHMQLINFSRQLQHVRMTRDPIVVWCLLSKEPLQINTGITLHCRKLESLNRLNYMTTAIVLVYLNFILQLLSTVVFESQEKMCKTSVNARPHCPLTSSFYRTRRNIRTNLILLETRLPAED